MYAPDASEKPLTQPFAVDYAMNDPAEGAQLKLQFLLTGDNPDGLYWIDVRWDGESLTMMPLRLQEQVPSEKDSA